MGETGDNLALVREAIARNASMVLSLPHGGRLRHHKSKFLADAGDGFWVKAVPGERPLLQSIIESHQPAGVSFRTGETKVMFATRVEHYQEDFTAPAEGCAAEALLLRFPDDVKAVQRRKNFRVPVPTASTDLQVKAWTMPETAQLRDKPPANREIFCEGRDISVGGIGLTIKQLGFRPPALKEGDRLRLQLTVRDVVVLLEGRVRHPAKTNEAALRVGIQFRVLGDGREDRQAAASLNKIVNELQREAIRRRKLGLS
jgi:c-di-GMP-binding flagellar brake protein YcgR